jgi:hypothetical protein
LLERLRIFARNFDKPETYNLSLSLMPRNVWDIEHDYSTKKYKVNAFSLAQNTRSLCVPIFRGIFSAVQLFLAVNESNVPSSARSKSVVIDVPIQYLTII